MRHPTHLAFRVLASCMVSLATTAALQAQQEPRDMGKEVEAPVTHARSPRANVRQLHFLYTGRLLGYFRIPDWQSKTGNISDCVSWQQKDQSLAASDFDNLLKENDSNGAILLGTGDNFAPELEARDFCFSGNDLTNAQSEYPRIEKDLFVWDGSNWILNKRVPDANSDTNNLGTRLALGQGTVPSDNAADFFVHFEYTALVPGKHDFYYGPERLRQLARHLASVEIKNDTKIHPPSVQMLGANLVIETNWKTDHKPEPDSEQDIWFIPRFPVATDLVESTDLEIKLGGLSDGAVVYPWFQGPTVQFPKTGDASVLRGILGKSNFYLCHVPKKDPSNPNDIPRPVNEKICTPLTNPLANSANKISFSATDGERPPDMLLPGENYGLCMVLPKGIGDIKAKDKDGGHTFCLRFSVYQPFFQFPWEHYVPQRFHAKPCDSYCDPDPYVVLDHERVKGLNTDVAIFGAVDPHLADYVGTLNLAYKNMNKGYKSGIAAKDPAEALQQLLGYFDAKYFFEHKHTFQGVRVLLAQMTPAEAKALATRLGGFQIVVSAADSEFATSEEETTTKWKDLGARANDHRGPQFVAVPEPYYVAGRESPWVVDAGSITLDLKEGADTIVELKSRHFTRPTNLMLSSHVNFWTAVVQALGDKDDCLTKDFKGLKVSDEQDQRLNQIQLLTLCAMRREAKADVAILQQRDFFPALPSDARDVGEMHDLAKKWKDRGESLQLQQLLDRVVWKGDFLNVLYVPGSAIKKALDQSKTFDAEDKSKTSLAGDKQRGLVYLGIAYDSVRSEYLINGVPLEPSKLYAVATSDYIGAGDTGYPDMATAQIKPPVVPKDFGNQLSTVSSAVCRQMTGKALGGALCLSPLETNDHFDQMIASPTDSRKGNTPAEQLEVWAIFHPSKSVPGDPEKLKLVTPDTTKKAALEATAKRHLWDFNLGKLSLGITTLSHNGSDLDVQNNFSGITSPGTNAFHSTTWASDFQAQLLSSWNHHQLFLMPGYTYNTQYKGQPDDLRQINQVADLSTVDLGYLYLFNGRKPEYFGLVFTSHFETPLTRAFLAFPLAGTHAGPQGTTVKDQIRFPLDRSYTDLLRPGLRWKRRVSSLEVGPEWGHQWEALEGINFLTNGVTTPCPATANQSISACVKNAIKNNPNSIIATSDVETVRNGQESAGIFWKWNLTVPFHPRVSYVLTDVGDWFFVRYHTDNSVTTLFRDYSQHQLKLNIFSSLSVGPEVDLLLYENKRTATSKNHFLRQDQVIMKAQFSFDLFNHQRVLDQVEYAPSPNSK